MSEGAIYCRVPHIRDTDQTGVDVQEAWCRDLARQRGVPVGVRHIYVDKQSSSWLRDRRRPGWEAMLAAASGFGHLLVYRLERFLRQPWDMADLLAAAESHGVVLHGFSDGRDLADPEQWDLLSAQVRRACRTASHVSVAARRAHERKAASGRPHGGGRRAYGYTPGMQELIEAEAAIVREVFGRFLAGETLRAIASDLNARAVPTAYGGNWSVDRIARLVDAPRYAGIQIFHGAAARGPDGRYLPGTWPPCVSVSQWEQARVLRLSRAAEAAIRRPARWYLLTGLAVCARCDRHMVGSMIGTYPFYACTSNGLLRPDRCTRHIAAEALEKFVADEAVRILAGLDPANLVTAPVIVPNTSRRASYGADMTRLAQLIDIRHPGRTDGAEHSDLVKRIRAAQRDIIIRPPGALDGVITGPQAYFAWDRLSRERKAAVLRYLFSVIRIGPSATSRGVFDYSRIHIVPNPL